MEYTKENPLRCFFAFEGYNSQGLALNRLKQNYPDFDWVCVGRSEIDKYAIQAADALFPEAKDKNYGNISKIDWNEIPDFDLFTYSFPCTNLSFAGKQEGCEEGSGTASSLLWECRKAIIAKRPKYLLMENVKALVSQKFLPYLLKWQNELASYGYSNFAKVLNARDFGIPQNRERIFMVSILDENANYHFPEPFPLDKRLKDVLENKVDERYYLSDKMLRYLNTRGGDKQSFVRGKGVVDGNGVATTCTANYYKMPGTATFVMESPIGAAIRSRDIKVCRQGGDVEPQCLTPKRTEYGKKVRKEYESGDLTESRHNMQQLEPREDGVCNTITSVQKDCLVIEPKIVEVAHKVEAMVNSTRSARCGVTLSRDNRIVAFQYDGRRGSVSEYKIDNEEGVSQTVMACREQKVYGDSTGFRIRKLTPREVLRLMDVDDANIDKIFSTGLSNSQIYKMGGNSICTGVLFHIFRKLFIDTSCESKQLSLF